MTQHHALTALALCALLAVAAGCRVVDETMRLPVRAVDAMVSPAPSKAMEPAELQSRVLRLADDFSAQSVEGIDDYARLSGLSPQHGKILNWKLASTASAIAIATGASPYVGLVDLASTSTLMTLKLEEDAARPGGAVFEPWLARQRTLESNVWVLAGTVLPAEQVEELRETLLTWRAENPELQHPYFVRPLQAVRPLASASRRSSSSSSVFSLVGLDPVAGLDPAVREVTRTRLLAERALFVAQRMPFLIRWHAELMADHLSGQPQVVRALDQLGAASDGLRRLGGASESLSRTAAGLPDRLSAERAALLAALEQQEGRLRELAAQVATTLAAGDRMATSLNTTIHSFDGLMKRFGVGEPPDPSRPPSDPDTPPFRVLDYAETADRLAVAARELDALFRDVGSTLDSPALDRRTRDLEASVRRIQADTRSLLNHAFLLAAALVGLVFLGLILLRRAGRPPGAPRA